MRFLEVVLDAPVERLPELAAFYGERLGLPPRPDAAGGAAFDIGETALRFRRGAGAPFYHVALLVPGDRFAAAHSWAAARVPLLPGPDDGSPHVAFPAWHADALYLHDPAGSILELIAHRGREERAATGPFAAAELVGVSEVGLVGDLPALASGLATLGLEVWDGAVDGRSRLAFVGEQARTLILAPAGRGWLPTGRAAEPHPVAVVVDGEPRGSVALDGGRYQVARAGGAAMPVPG